MMKLYDLCVATRKYTHNGEEKTSWLNVGSILQGDNNPFMMMKAHFNPAGITRKEGAESIVVSMFTPKDSPYNYINFHEGASTGTKLYDMLVGTRKYTRDGQEKTAWENVGAIIMGEKSPYMMLKAHFNPAAIQRKEGSESISISLFKPKPKEQSNSYTGGYSGDSYDNPDNFTPIDLNAEDIPF